MLSGQNGALRPQQGGCGRKKILFLPGPLSLLWPQLFLLSGHSKQRFPLGEGQGQACKFGEGRLLGVLSSGT